jgi:LuxR family maltose regulon positive regulatory protein
MKTCPQPQAFPPAGFIPRHLYDVLLTKLTTHRLTLLCAPGGYGKSTALAYCLQNIHRTGAQGLWISAEQRTATDSDILLKAISEQLPGPTTATPEALLARLQSIKAPLVLFIDTYEQLENPVNTCLLEKILQLNQPLLHIALACRHQTALKLSSLELQGQVHSLDSTQLSFSADETSLLLSQELPASQREHLHQLTEGWPLAINLCRILARDKKQSAKLVAFSGRDQGLRTFFQEQVLANLDQQQQNFLSDFAVLGNGCSALCNYALQRRDSHGQLESLYRDGAFIEARDRNLDDYRLHRLFREFLLDQRSATTNQRKLLVRATHWSIRHQRYRQAADYARSSGEPRVARLVISKTSEILVRNLGELPTIVDWTRDMQVSSIFEWNELVYWSTWSLAFSYCWQDAQNRIQQLTLAIRTNTSFSPDERRNYESKLDSLGLVLAIFQDQTDGVAERSARWLEQHSDADAFDIAVIASAQLISLRLEANCSGALSAAARAISAIQRSGSVYGNIWVNLLKALYQLEFGDYSRARLLLNEQFYLAAQEIGEHSAILSTCALLLSRIAYEQDDLDSAGDYVDLGYRHIKSHGLIETAIAGISVRARLAARTSLCEALQVLDEAQAIIAVYPHRLEILLHQHRIELLLDHGRTSEALIAYTALEHLMTQAEYQDTRLVPHLNQAYIELLLSCAREQYDVAQQRSRELLCEPALSTQPLLNCRTLIIQAALLAQNEGETEHACEVMRKALQVASEHNLYRVFLDLRRFSNAPLQLLLNVGEQNLTPSARELFKRLCDDLQLRAQASKKSQHLTEPLSRRELELLTLLESGLTYQQIADKLFISLATVKWHVYNIYGKLGVKNRSGALVTARQLQLLGHSA